MNALKANYEQRRDIYNQNPIDTSLGGYTHVINDVLKKKENVAKRHAEKSEKEVILKAVMGTALVHLDEGTTSYLLPKHGLQAGDVLYKHYEILRLTEKLAREYADKSREKGEIDLTVLGYDILYAYSGIDQSMFSLWFKDILKEHSKGLGAYDSAVKNLYKSNETLWCAGQSVNDEGIKKNTLFNYMYSVSQNPKHPEAMSALSNIRSAGYHLDAGKDAGIVRCLSSLLENQADINNKTKAFQQVVMLWHSNSDEKEMARIFLHKIGGDSEHPKQIEALKYLYAGNNEDQDIAFKSLPEIVQNQKYDSLELAEWFLSKDTKNAKAFAYSILREIAKNPSHTYAWPAIKRLIRDGAIIDEKTALSVLQAVIEKPDHQYAVTETIKMWKNHNLGVKELFRPILRELAHDMADPSAFEATNALWDVGNVEDKKIGKDSLLLIADASGHVNQKDAIKLLRESNAPEDQQKGLELQLKHFPVTLDSATTVRMSRFNRDAIREAMPDPLPDLSATKMNIVAEFQSLMQLMSAQEIMNGNINPYYMSPNAINEGFNAERNPDITPEIFLEYVRTHVASFLKTLTGQPQGPNDVEIEWKMYDENKPDMINSLKHIIIALKELINNNTNTNNNRNENVANIQSSMNNLGMVLNGILYCPTGQVEGIESVVNFLIRGNNTLSSDARELVGKSIIAPAVQKAFNNAFHDGGAVHARARARMALTYELGIRYAIGSFKERISKLEDAEIPGFYNDFYKKFTFKFILEEARRNIQTPEESQKIQDAKTDQERRAVKVIKKKKDSRR